MWTLDTKKSGGSGLQVRKEDTPPPLSGFWNVCLLGHEAQTCITGTVGKVFAYWIVCP